MSLWHGRESIRLSRTGYWKIDGGFYRELRGHLNLYSVSTSMPEGMKESFSSISEKSLRYVESLKNLSATRGPAKNQRDGHRAARKRLYQKWITEKFADIKRKGVRFIDIWRHFKIQGILKARRR